MATIIVVVTFYSRNGTTEALAHAAAVGAVQARAGIRLRRVPDGEPEAVIARLPESSESLRRMHREYVAPREADVLAADALIVASPADVDASSPEWTELMDLLTRLQAEGKLAGKVMAAVADHSLSTSFGAVIERLGVATVTSGAASPADRDAVARAVALGRAVVAQAKALRDTSGGVR